MAEASESAREALIGVLRHAYSGERAAAYAYRGHARSVRDPGERSRIRQIEDEEWRHRELVGGLLRQLGARPSPVAELRAAVIGRTLGALCFVAGWFAPMYGAGRLESGNIVEYEDAARYARDGGRPELADCLLEMAEVEWEHEAYFRSRIEGSRWLRVFPLWPKPSPKEEIRRHFVQRI